MVRNDTLWYVTIRCRTLQSVVVRYAAWHNVATATLQRGTARHNPTLIFTAGLQRADNVASMLRQRGTAGHTAEMYKYFSRTWGSETGPNGAAKTWPYDITGESEAHSYNVPLHTHNI